MNDALECLNMNITSLEEMLQGWLLILPNVTDDGFICLLAAPLAHLYFIIQVVKGDCRPLIAITTWCNFVSKTILK